MAMAAARVFEFLVRFSPWLSTLLLPCVPPRASTFPVTPLQGTFNRVRAFSHNVLHAHLPPPLIPAALSTARGILHFLP